MNSENLVPMTIRLESLVADALAAKAHESGQEVADYAADILTQDVREELERLSPSVAARVQAELKLKKMAISYAKELTAKKFDEDVTLQVFPAHPRR